MKSFVQSTSSKVLISSKLGADTYVSKPMLPLDSTRYLKPETAIVIDYMLDSISATRISAYSLRILRQGYTGPCIKLRRSSDNTALDFNFTKYGIIDLEAIAAWASGANLFVDTWYDQSGNAKHIVQGTTGSQPSFNVGDSSTNNHPFVYIGEGANKKLQNTSINVNGLSEAIIGACGVPIGNQSAGGNNVDNAIFFVNESGGWGTFSMSLLAGQVAWRFGTGQGSNSNSITRSPSRNAICSGMVVKRSSNEFVFLNGAQLGATATGKITPTANNSSTLQVGGGDGGNCPNFKCLELFCLSTAPSGVETTIYNSQKAAYGL